MNTPISHDPAKVRTADGAIWLRAAVTTAGRGLYALEGVEGCPRYVLATLPELAVYGVQVVVDELVDAVALLGALPMPVGCPSPGALAEQPHLVDELDHTLEHLADEVPEEWCTGCNVDHDPAVCNYGPAPLADEAPDTEAEQRHPVDPMDHVLEHLADNAPAADRRAESVATLRGLLARQSGGAL